MIFTYVINFLQNPQSYNLKLHFQKYSDDEGSLVRQRGMQQIEQIYWWLQKFVSRQKMCSVSNLFYEFQKIIDINSRFLNKNEITSIIFDSIG